jgi:hypothetical protein
VAGFLWSVRFFFLLFFSINEAFCFFPTFFCWIHISFFYQRIHFPMFLSLFFVFVNCPTPSRDFFIQFRNFSGFFLGSLSSSRFRFSSEGPKSMRFFCVFYLRNCFAFVLSIFFQMRIGMFCFVLFFGVFFFLARGVWIHFSWLGVVIIVKIKTKTYWNRELKRLKCCLFMLFYGCFQVFL